MLPSTERVNGQKPAVSKESLLRQKLFKKGKPFIRRFEHEKDLWLLWASYDLGGFDWIERGLDKDKFVFQVMAYMSVFHNLWLIEDDNPYFKGRRGPVCIVGIQTNGWSIEPHFEFFKWASKRSILRCMVMFFQKARHDKQVGVVVGRTFKKYVDNLTHLKKYGVLFYCGKIPNGFPQGDEYVFYVKGARALMNEEEIQRCLQLPR